jgi:hypothetical protein
MNPEIDYTRQRTVAELLAEHGDAGAAVRRRRRRGGDGPERAVAPPGPPPVGVAGPPPAGRRYPTTGPRPEQDRAVLRDPAPREVGPQAAGRDLPPVRRGASGPRRERPTEMIADRRRRPDDPSYTGPVGFRDAPARPAPSTPNVPGRSAGPPSGSGPLRAVPSREPVRGAPSTGGSGPLRTGGSGPLRAVPPRGGPATTGSGPLRVVPSRDPARGAPAPGGSGRLRAVPPRPGAVPSGRETPPNAAPARGAAPPAAGPVRNPAGRRDRAVPDPGPATGAWDPLSFDDEDDEVGPATVVGPGGRDGRRGPAAARRDGPPRAGVRRGDGSATEFDVTARRGGGPELELDVSARRSDGPATDFDVTSVRRPAGSAGVDDGRDRRTGPRPAAGPVTAFDVAGDRRVGPRPGAGPTEFDPLRNRAGGRRRAPARTGFGVRAGRTAVTPAAAFGGAAAPAAFGGAPAPAGVGGSARTTVDEPTELTDRDDLDDRTDVARPRRDAVPTAFPAAPDDDPDRPADDGYDDYRDPDYRDPDYQDPDYQDDAEPLDDVAPDELDELDDGLDDDELDDERPRPQAWAGVVAQWLAGAVAGAVVWVLFRYLWRSLPVVALAAALLVTAGLVLLVRQLLPHVDRRTTVFAVLVGLLLTASPAVLVLLGR